MNNSDRSDETEAVNELDERASAIVDGAQPPVGAPTLSPVDLERRVEQFRALSALVSDVPRAQDAIRERVIGAALAAATTTRTAPTSAGNTSANDTTKRVRAFSAGRALGIGGGIVAAAAAIVALAINVPSGDDAGSKAADSVPESPSDEATSAGSFEAAPESTVIDLGDATRTAGDASIDSVPPAAAAVAAEAATGAVPDLGAVNTTDELRRALAVNGFPEALQVGTSVASATTTGGTPSTAAAVTTKAAALTTAALTTASTAITPSTVAATTATTRGPTSPRFAQPCDQLGPVVATTTWNGTPARVHLSADGFVVADGTCNILDQVLR
jgi:hypothetical protein